MTDITIDEAKNAIMEAEREILASLSNLVNKTGIYVESIHFDVNDSIDGERYISNCRVITRLTRNKPAIWRGEYV